MEFNSSYSLKPSCESPEMFVPFAYNHLRNSDFQVFANEVPVFLREHHNGMYRTEVYFLCKMIAELPIYVICPLLSVAIPYYAIGLNPAIDRFLIAAALVILVTQVAISFGIRLSISLQFVTSDRSSFRIIFDYIVFDFAGYMISCLAPTVEVANAIAAPLILPSLLFGGFFLNNGQVPDYFDWLRYVSWFMYTNEALSINQWAGVRFNSPECANSTFLPSQSLVYCTGEDVLEQFSFEDVTRSSFSFLPLN